jgi:UDP-glucose 4-epimerase
MIERTKSLPDRTLSGKRVLLTGGAGFVGSNLARLLVHQGAELTILDDFFTGSLDNLWEIENCYQLVRASVTNRELVSELVSQADIVFHLAARNIIAATRSPYEDFQTNIGGTLNVLLAAKEHGVQRVIYTSSASVYGNPQYLPINEDDRVNLLTPYAVSKYAGEGYCRAFYESYGLPVVVVRYSNVYGIGQSPSNPYCGVVAKFVEKAHRNEPLDIHGDGEQTRDFTFVQDAIEATLLAGISSKAEGEVFNIGTGIETSVNTLARQIRSLYGSNREPLHIDRRDIDNIRRRVVNVEKIRRMLRWSPSFTLAEGLQRTWEWFERSHAKEVSLDINVVPDSSGGLDNCTWNTIGR